jgi:hypothetical protein
MRYGPKNLKISFGAKNLTHFGGVYLLHLFFKKLSLRRRLFHSARFPRRNNRYSVAEEILALIYPICLGIGRIETTHLLKQNGVFQRLTGLSVYPHSTTLRRFLFQMAPKALAKLRRLHRQLRAVMILRPAAPTKVIFDLDSTVLTVYGKQELTLGGYNPAKPGRASYHPLLCFNGLTRDFWQGEFRSGKAYTSTNAIPLLKASFAQLPPSVKSVTIRADKGFYDHQIIEYLETQNARFAIAARLTRPLKRRLAGLTYRKYASGLATAEFFYQPHNWKKRYRFIAIRRPVPEDPSEQLTLFTVSKHTYQVIVTDLPLLPLNVWKYYNRRAAVELIIKELKGSYPLAKIPSHHFAANEAYFHLLLFSYNLINWFKRLCLPKEFHNMTLATLRSRLLLVPSELTMSDNKPTLKLPANFLYKDAFTSAMKKIDKLKI